MRMMTIGLVLLATMSCGTITHFPEAPPPAGMTNVPFHTVVMVETVDKRYTLQDMDNDGLVSRIAIMPGHEGRIADVYYIVETQEEAYRLNEQYIRQHVIPELEGIDGCKAESMTISEATAYIGVSPGAAVLDHCRKPGVYIAEWYIPRRSERASIYQYMFEKAHEPPEERPALLIFYS